MWEAIAANRRRSLVLIAMMGTILLALGWVIGMAIEPRSGGPLGLGIAAIVWIVTWLTAVAGGDAILLASAGAHKIEKSDAPQLWNVVEEMTIAAGLAKVPEVYIIDDPSPNAFAVGRRPEVAAVAVTTGLLKMMNRDQLQGVVAHELGHVRNLDIRFMTLAAVMMGSVALLSDFFLRWSFWGGGRRSSSSRRGDGEGQAQAIIMIVALVVAILAPILIQILYFACSRRREYLADASAARFTRWPEGLASALEKLARASLPMANKNRAVAPLFIVNPVQALSAESVFATHPPLEKRIQVLRAMGDGAGFANYEAAFQKVQGEGARCLGNRTLGQAEAVGLRPAEPPPSEQIQPPHAREAIDLLDRRAGMRVIQCECGLNVKLPPAFATDRPVACPRCGRQLKTSAL